MVDIEGEPKKKSIFTLPPGVPFLDTLAKSVLDGQLPALGGVPPAPIELPAYTILLPTPRAVRGLQDAFLRASRSESALLLPRLRPISLNDDDAALLTSSGGEFSTGDLAILPAVSELERRLILMQFVQSWSVALETSTCGHDDRRAMIEVAARSPARAAKLAVDLAQLIDQLDTECVQLDQLANLVPEDFSAHWQQTIEFLDIVVRHWPQYLVAARKLSPAERRNKLILAEAERLRLHPPAGPVLVAGVSGSVPATAELMLAVACLPNGAIVLPGLDRSPDRSGQLSGTSDTPSHPQFGFQRLLRKLGTRPEDVSVPAHVEVAPCFAVRTEVIAEAMRPADRTDAWHKLSGRLTAESVETAFEDITYLPAPSLQDEAEVISLVLREALEEPGRTAALVTPDRTLARRVGARLSAWGIRVDDSAGVPFGKTALGAFLDLVITTIAQDFAPEALMSLLRHPLTRLGHDPGDIRRAASSLELAAFRAPYFGSGMEGVQAALDSAALDVASGSGRGPQLRRLGDGDWRSARELVDDLRSAFAPLVEIWGARDPRSLSCLAKAHVGVAEALAQARPNPSEGTHLWLGEAGVLGHAFFTSLFDSALSQPQIRAIEYPDLYRALIAHEPVRPTISTHPRLAIWGPYEARLMTSDVVVLGGLNDGTWPAPADPGPWLNRPMRRTVGLPVPEEQLGYAAHDFTQLLGAQTVYLTRAERVDGNPTVPSRWLLRLMAVLASLGCGGVLDPAMPWLTWATERPIARNGKRRRPPQPRPGLSLRPRRMSVSDVEAWIANPYAIFAKKILKLHRLPPLGAAPDAALRGSIVHNALGEFVCQYPRQLPGSPDQELLKIAMRMFAELKAHPRIEAFWMARFGRFAAWFGATEPALRKDVVTTIGEKDGVMLLDGPAGPFTLTARADRIDVGRDGLTITDYKTGSDLQGLARRACALQAPQLLLEAMIARAGGFNEIADTRIAGLRYISAAGGDPPGAIVELEVGDVEQLVLEIHRELQSLIALFDDETTPYVATRRSQFRYDFDDYAQLARIAEWANESLDENI
ncbi:MAG: double-strand break repair protein AddB [Hyphomicrobiaceae bacterium]